MRHIKQTIRYHKQSIVCVLLPLICVNICQTKQKTNYRNLSKLLKTTTDPTMYKRDILKVQRKSLLKVSKQDRISLFVNTRLVIHRRRCRRRPLLNIQTIFCPLFTKFNFSVFPFVFVCLVEFFLSVCLSRSYLICQ